MVPAAGAVGLANYDRWFQRLKPLVSASETDAPSCWSRRSQQARPMLSEAGAVGFDSLVGLGNWISEIFKNLNISQTPAIYPLKTLGDGVCQRVFRWVFR
ncbi:hypothetical protein PCASD_11738 [Puccinia coronata f. sp. avenae]|uniref:Uncharacterized protein n=1 Tax=Puccinia coronata f. sp. avenae TaxID=200324 RepID=A0A2N5S3R6_9BASI|nr:hypothetical protein PCASD_25997 [Puccinia coronata f. sp. avenae]PLW40047.1 hypothetical protein PCASD_11738 [Puccinia coronata f. sp. avenae]